MSTKKLLNSAQKVVLKMPFFVKVGLTSVVVLLQSPVVENYVHKYLNESF